MGDAKALDAMVHDGLTNPFSGRQMFDEATEVGDELELTRPDLDRWALRSHELAMAAIDDGRMSDEIVAVTVKGRKGDTVVEVDEGPRRGASLEALAKLPGLAGKEGSHTAGNSPGVNDGGGALVLACDEWARPTARRRWPRSSPTPRAPTTSPTSPRRRARAAGRRSTRPACSPGTSTSGRSTRRSPRSR